MLTHQVPIHPKSTQDHRNSLSLLSTCNPDSFNLCLLPCPLNGIQNLKPIKATHRHPGQARRLPATVDCRGQEKEKRIPPFVLQTQHHRLSPRKTLETIRSWGVNAKERETGQCSWWRDPMKRKVLGPHEEESPGAPRRGKSCFWMRYEMGEGLPAVCQNSSLLTLVHACKSSWPSPLSVLAEYPALGRGALQCCLLS